MKTVLGQMEYERADRIQLAEDWVQRSRYWTFRFRKIMKYIYQPFLHFLGTPCTMTYNLNMPSFQSHSLSLKSKLCWDTEHVCIGCHDFSPKHE
jgi:hypothetical protein